MGRLSDAFKKSLMSLDDLHERLQAWENAQSEEEHRIKLADLRQIGFQEHEIHAWLQQEPDFAKRIVTPLNPKRRGNRTSARKTYMKLLFVVSVSVISGGFESCH